MMRRAALVAALALAAPTTWFAPHARACSCSVLDLEWGIKQGWTLALVTRTDVDGSDMYGGRFRIERTVGPNLGVSGEVRIESNNVCSSETLPLQTRPFYLRREDEHVVAEGCGDFDTGPTLQRILGTAPTTSTGTPVAILAGDYGSSRLAAVDDRGEVVAWDRRPGSVGAVAVCPGGRNVIAYGSARRPENNWVTELTVHDARTLALVRTLALPADGQPNWGGSGLRCTDAEGTRAQLLGSVGTLPGASAALYTLTERTTERVNLATTIGAGAADAHGFLAVTGGDGPEFSLMRITQSGEVRVLRSGLPQLGHFVLSPDGRTVAASATGTEKHPLPDGNVVTLDTGKGASLASWSAPTGVGGLAWTAGGDLLVAADSYFRYDSGRARPIEVRDRMLRPLGTRPQTPGRLSAIGNNAAGFRQTRLTLIGSDGSAQVVDNLWLTGATGVTSLLEPAPETDLPSTNDRLPWILGGFGALALAIALGRVRWGARQRSI